MPTEAKKITMRYVSDLFRALAIGVICISSSSAQWQVNFSEVPDSDSAKHQDNFGAMLLLSDKPDEFLEAWGQPTPGVIMDTTDSVSRGVPIVAFVVFTGCEPNSEGFCNASIDFVVQRPDGTEYASYIDKDLWRMKPPIREDFLELSASYIGVIIEPEDPLGPYRVNVAVRDDVAGIELKLFQSFTATE